MTATISADAVVKDLVSCGYVKAADVADRFGDPSSPRIRIARSGHRRPGGIFTQAEFDGDAEFRKTAAVMKMVINGFAGAGTIAMGGYDYHPGPRHRRDARLPRRALHGRLPGVRRRATTAAVSADDVRLHRRLAVENGMIDDSPTAAARASGPATTSRPPRRSSSSTTRQPAAAARRGCRRTGAAPADRLLPRRRSVETSATPAANNVNLLVETVVLNYMALHGEQGQFAGCSRDTGSATPRCRTA